MWIFEYFADTELNSAYFSIESESNQPKYIKMLKIQMLEQIMSSDNVAEEQKNASDQSAAPRTPTNMSPRRTG